MKEIIRIQNRPDGRVDVLNLIEGKDEAIVLVRGLERNKSLDLVINTQTSVSVDDVVELKVLKAMQGHSGGEHIPTKVTFKPEGNLGKFSTSYTIRITLPSEERPFVYLILSDNPLGLIIDALIDAHDSTVLTPIYLDREKRFKMSNEGADRWKLTYTDTHGNMHHYKFSHDFVIQAAEQFSMYSR